MSTELEQLYQEVILDHAKHPHGRGLRGGTAASSHQINPTCGDEVTFELHLGTDGRVADGRWGGHGCAISQASASLLSVVVPGLSPAELRERIDGFRTALRSRGAIAPDEDLVGDAAALAGVSRYPARVKCAMLAWVAAEDALNRGAVG
ncbi:SUF system NifU family Fe-S cluster assembly protein [Pseudolysinimonas kribbensis]|uniref:Fe-S cluster assembly sulfur transfer protein SufU n=1 Tax=Pseudolysinimonas kribbensis TaxID=433641 RepID=UPI0031DED9F5